MSKKNKSVLVSVEGNPEEKFEIPMFFLKHWRNVLTASGTIIIMLFVTLIIFSITEQPYTPSTDQEIFFDRIEAERQLLDLSQDDPQNAINGGSGQSKIDSTVKRINEKMRRRGLSPITIPNVGGPIESSPKGSKFSDDHYETLIKEIDLKLSEAPLGVPHFGGITSRFGYRRNPFTNSGVESHLGIDFRGKIGDKIRATARGKIISTGHQGGYGFVVKIAHANGYETRYAHLSGILVKPGQIVEAGTEIALLGSTGRSTGPHLHYEILKDNKKINPEKYLAF